MLKLAVVGAQTLLGRELVNVLEAQEVSVMPLSTGPLTLAQEEADLVVFAPDPALLEGLDVVILADTPQAADMLEGFPGRILDLRSEPEGQALPFTGIWPAGVQRLKGRHALEMVLAQLPHLIENIGEVGGTHLRAVAHLGQLGVEALMAQSVDLLNGKEPDTAALGYRAAFEAVPQVPRGNLLEVRVPVFHGDLLVLHLRATEGQSLTQKAAPEGIRWVEAPPSSREVAITSELLAHLAPSADGKNAILTLGFDPVLWGILRPAMRLLEIG